VKTKHIFMSAEHNAGKSHKIKTANKNLSKCGTVKHLGMRLKNRNCVMKSNAH